MKNNLFKSHVLNTAIFINSAIFFFLSILHFYWALGGKLWYNDVLPTSSNGLHKFSPTMSAGLIVAFGLLAFALITIGNKGLFDRHIKRRYFGYGNLLIAAIFFTRAIGDFKFIGFFKTVKGTSFGINDTRIFSPLCLFIASISVLIFLLAKTTISKV